MQFALALLLAQSLGIAAVGYFFFYFAWAYFLGFILSFGAPMLYMRRFARANGVDRAAFKKLGVASVTVGLILLIPTTLFAPQISLMIWGTRDLAWLIFLTTLAGLAAAQIRMAADALKGVGRYQFSLSLEFLGPPLVTTGALLIGRTAPWPTTAETIIGIHVFSLFISYFIMLLALWRCNPVPSMPIRFRSLVKLWSVSLLNPAFNSLPFLVLPTLFSAEFVGVFAIAQRLAGLGGTITTSLGAYGGPLLADFWSRDKITDFIRLHWNLQILGGILFTPLLVAIILVPSQILSLFSANSVAGGAAILILMVASRSALMWVGPTDISMVMVGYPGREFLHGALGMTIAIIGSVIALTGHPWFALIGIASGLLARGVVSRFFLSVKIRRALEGASSGAP